MDFDTAIRIVNECRDIIRASPYTGSYKNGGLEAIDKLESMLISEELKEVKKQLQKRENMEKT